MPTHLNGASRLYPIIGDPVSSTRSPELLTASFAARGHDGVCVPMQVSEHDLDDVMRGLTATPNVEGLLVTMPHKFRAAGYCESRSDRSRLLGVVSVMRRTTSGSWHGDMLDGVAFVRAMRAQGAEFAGATALLVGAGGTGGAIAIELLRAGVAGLVVHDIDERRVADLVDAMSADDRRCVRSGPPDVTGFDIVCNATPLGLRDGDDLPVDPDSLTSSMFVGDVISGRGVTPLLAAAGRAGCRMSDGDQMVEAVQTLMVDFMLHSDDGDTS